MIRKIIIALLVLSMLIGCVSAIDSSNWTNATVGYENFKIPPKYENPINAVFLGISSPLLLIISCRKLSYSAEADIIIT